MAKQVRTRYQRPTGDGPQLVTPSYERPEEPSVPDVLETTESAETRPKPDAIVEPLQEPHHVTLGEAVPVRVVNFARELDRVTGFAASQFTVAAGGSVAVPGRRNRTRMVMRNENDNTSVVYLSHEDIRSAAVGYPLPAGETLEQFHSGTVYVYNSDTTNSVTVGVYEEYTTELK